MTSRDTQRFEKMLSNLPDGLRKDVAKVFAVAYMAIEGGDRQKSLHLHIAEVAHRLDRFADVPDAEPLKFKKVRKRRKRSTE